MASNKIDMNKIIADLGKKNKPTEATRLSDEFPELAKSFKDGAFPVPSFPGSTVPRLKPKSERASFDLTDAQKELRWRFVGRAHSAILVFVLHRRSLSLSKEILLAALFRRPP